ncbi:YciI family protein [Cupriavidus necator]|uniref:YciI family protein n=1 Tax=Cupriavidus necator TaxID=106590 RepID=UPI0039C04161
MFIVELTYTQPLDAIEARLSEHRRFLDAQYARGLFLVSGPKNPRDGGVILVSGLIARNELDKLLREDPFHKNGLAEYRVTEFAALKHHPALAKLL